MYYHTIRLGALTTESINSGLGFFSSPPHPDWLWGLPCLFIGYWVHFPGDEMARAMEHTTAICGRSVRWSEDNIHMIFSSVVC
jgi:hypothetical protein